MARVNGAPTAVRGSLQMNSPELPFSLRCFHSSSRMKFSYMRAVRMTPMGSPVVTIMPSRAAKVLGAQFTLTQPERSLPLNNGTKPSFCPAADDVTASQVASTIQSPLLMMSPQGKGSSLKLQAGPIIERGVDDS